MVDKKDEKLFRKKQSPGNEEPDPANEDDADEAAERLEDSEEPETPARPADDRAAEQSNASAGTESEWFVDFDVWEATLKAHFGPDFEVVLSATLGPEWASILNARLQEQKNFYNVIEEIKSQINGREPEEESLDNQEITFQALEPGEVIYDPNYVGPVGPGSGGGGGGGGGKQLPNLTDLRRKDFETPEDLKIDANAKEYEKKLVSDQEAPVDDELVLMERSEFTRMSYLAHKELERHTDELKTAEVAARISLAEKKAPVSLLLKILIFMSSLVCLYLIFCLVTLPICGYYSKKLLLEIPPDFYFRPSTALHIQGELGWAQPPGSDQESSPLVVFFLRSPLKRLDLNQLRAGVKEQYDLAVCQNSTLEIPDGPRGDSISVHKHYNQYLPTNLSAFSKSPFLSLEENGAPVLSAHETTWSGFLPGHTRLTIADRDGIIIGEAYIAEARLNIRINGLDNLTAGQVDLLAARLALLFCLLKI